MLLFPNTLWVMKTHVVIYFPKPWHCNHQTRIFNTLSLRTSLDSSISRKPVFIIITKKLNTAANMFASTQGTTEVIAAALQKSLYKEQQTPSTVVSTTVSKHLLGQANVYCFIFSKTLELQPQKTYFQIVPLHSWLSSRISMKT